MVTADQVKDKLQEALQATDVVSGRAKERRWRAEA